MYVSLYFTLCILYDFAYTLFICHRENMMIQDPALNNPEQVKKAHRAPLHLGVSIVLVRRLDECKSLNHCYQPHLALRSVVHQTVRQWTWTLQVTFMACIRLLVFKHHKVSMFLFLNPVAIHTAVKLCLWKNELEKSLTSICTKLHTLIVLKETNGQIFDCNKSNMKSRVSQARHRVEKRITPWWMNNCDKRKCKIYCFKFYIKIKNNKNNTTLKK